MAAHDEDHMSAKSSSARSISKAGIDIEKLPPNLKVAVDELNLDTDGNGRLDTQEIIMAVEHLAAKTKANTSLKKIVYLLCGFSVVLVAALFGASIAAARLAKDTAIDADTGIMYAKGPGHAIMKTEEALFRDEKNIAMMSNEDLNALKALVLTKGDVKFQVKGYSRSGSIDGNQVMLLVEGGTITFDPEGIMDATGDAEDLLVFAYGEFTEEEVVTDGSTEGTGRRARERGGRERGERGGRGEPDEQGGGRVFRRLGKATNLSDTVGILKSSSDNDSF
mmetsp:Transcript_45235/g.50342  ORF Transcript_45235/g.50342 Transcript_45235/m.50342 type:complete len:279 (+) Transcript_45235:189-1025(+)